MKRYDLAMNMYAGKRLKRGHIGDSNINPAVVSLVEREVLIFLKVQIVLEL